MVRVLVLMTALFVSNSWAAALLPTNPNAPAHCPQFQERYKDCQQLGGELSRTYEAVWITTSPEHISLHTRRVDGKTMKTEFFPDRIVRLGIDYFTNSNGDRQRIHSHESAYCADGKVTGLEMGFLPDGSVSREVFEVRPTRTGIQFSLKLGERVLFDIACTTDQ